MTKLILGLFVSESPLRFQCVQVFFFYRILQFSFLLISDLNLSLFVFLCYIYICLYWYYLLQVRWQKEVTVA